VNPYTGLQGTRQPRLHDSSGLGGQGPAITALAARSSADDRATTEPGRMDFSSGRRRPVQLRLEVCEV